MITEYYNKQDLIDLVDDLKNYTAESHTILGHDDRDAREFVDIFLKNRKRINAKPITREDFYKGLAMIGLVISKGSNAGQDADIIAYRANKIAQEVMK